MATPNSASFQAQEPNSAIESASAHSPAPRSRRRWLRFSLRTMLLLVTVLSIWLGVKVNQARRQKEAVAALRESGATVRYAHQQSDANPRIYLVEQDLDVPRWLRDLTGDDFFQSVALVEFMRPVTDDDLTHLAALPEIETLSFLYLSSHAGGNVTDAGLAHLPRPDRLVRFHASDMSIGDAFLERLANASGLEDLALGDTHITHRGIASLGGLKSLEYMSIADRDLGDAALEALPPLPALKRLALNGWNITDAGLAHLARQHSLSMLMLSNTSIGDEGLAHLAKLESLTTLHISNTRITDAGLRHLARLPNLRALDLQSTEVRGPGLRHIATLVEDWLILKRTRIDDAALRELKGAERLLCLDLEDTAITDAGLVHLHGLPNLSLISLDGTQVTAQGLAALNKAMPTLGIVTAPQSALMPQTKQ